MSDDEAAPPREMFAWVTTDKDGKRHFVGALAHGPGGMLLHQHLISHDLALMHAARDLAEQHAKVTRQPVQLIRLVQVEILETCGPFVRLPIGSDDESADGYCGAPMSVVQSVRRARARYHDPTCPPRVCENEACRKTFTGPALYCSLECAIADSGAEPLQMPPP